MAEYLVTGGAGFIGSNIVEELVRRKKKVRVLDNFLTGRKDNLKSFINKIELMKGDIRDIAACRKAVKNIAFVLHQAALRSVPKSVDNPILANDINVSGTLNMLIASCEAGVKRFVYASSSSIYGDSEVFPQREDFLPQPISPYAVSKLAGEYYCKVFSKGFGLETVSLRYFNVFGPRQNPESKYSAVIPAFISKLLNKRNPIIYGNGRQMRDFTYVSNVVEANIKAALAPPPVSGRVFNVARGNSVSVIELLNMIKDIVGSDIKPEFYKKRKGDVYKTLADIGFSKKLLKLKMEVGLKEGLTKTVEWFYKNPHRLRPYRRLTKDGNKKGLIWL